MSNECPAQGLLKMLSGKWKLEIFKLASQNDVRFSGLMRSLPGANRQSLSLALREMEGDELLEKVVLQQKPLHIEYRLTEKARQLLPLLQQFEGLA